jgi:hypothetical protein
MGEKIIGYPDFESLTVSAPQGHRRVVDIEFLAQEFDPTGSKEFAPKLTTVLGSTGEDVAINPEGNARGAELYRLENNQGEVVGVAVSKYYSWDLMRNSVGFYKIRRDNSGNIETLGLSTFEYLANPKEEGFSLVIELAYNTIDSEYRGQGLGGKLFALRIARAASIKTEKPKIVWTMSRGAHLSKGTGNRIFEYLRNEEEKVNGEHEDGRTIITGIDIPVEKIKIDLELPANFQFDEVYDTSLPIVRLAARFGMIQIGLFRDLSPVFALVQNNS